MTTLAASVEEGRFRGEPAVVLSAGELVATFLPDLGMTGVSLRCRGREHLALPGGLPALRSGKTMGLPLLAPWANRLGSRRYRAAGVDVDLAGLPLGTDANGLPIHGLLVGQPGWRLERRSTGRGRAAFRASIDVDAPAFPYPHRIEVRSSPVTTTSRSTRRSSRPARRAVPVAFGWHPYLRLPGTPGASGISGCRPAPISPSTRSASRPGRRRPRRGRANRSAGAPSTTCTSLAASVASPWSPTTTLDHAPLWTRVPVRPGVGAGRPAVRRAGADGRRHEQPGRRHDTARATGRRLHRQLHAGGGGTVTNAPAPAGRGRQARPWQPAPRPTRCAPRARARHRPGHVSGGQHDLHRPRRARRRRRAARLFSCCRGRPTSV